MMFRPSETWKLWHFGLSIKSYQLQPIFDTRVFYQLFFVSTIARFCLSARKLWPWNWCWQLDPTHFSLLYLPYFGLWPQWLGSRAVPFPWSFKQSGSWCNRSITILNCHLIACAFPKNRVFCRLKHPPSKQTFKLGPETLQFASRFGNRSILAKQNCKTKFGTVCLPAEIKPRLFKCFLSEQYWPQNIDGSLV